MCSLCGILSERGHWTESATHPEVFARRREVQTTLRERQQRVRLLNRVLKHYGLSVSDWSGNAYILRNRTGQSAILADLSALWEAADRMSKTHCDPLDEGLLQSLADG